MPNLLCLPSSFISFFSFTHPKVDGFVPTITAIVKSFDPTLDTEKNCLLRESKAGKYISLSLTITATSKQQLDDMYKALSEHPMVKLVM